MQNLNLNLLAGLDVLLRERSVTRAAERLGLTQSAMSHILKRLRESFGDPLFVRIPGGMKPTPRAAAMAEPLARALSDLMQAVRPPAAFEPAKAKRRFTIATDDYLERILLPRLLARLWREAPGIDVQVTPAGKDMAGDLISGRADVLISVSGAVGLLPGAYSHRLFDERFVCVMRENHPLAGRKLTLEKFVSFPHALVAPARRPGSIVDRALAKLGKRRRVALTLPHFLASPEIVAATDLILTTGERLAKTMAPGFHITRPPLQLPELTVALFWHERNQADQAHRWFRSVVTEAAKEI